jgi:quercetin dioxygenase-like cupin family protein
MKLAITAVVFLSFVHGEDMGVTRKLSATKLAPMPGLPACVTLAVENGDPTKDASTLIFKGTAGCRIPWHWHSPVEEVMMVSGSAKVEMKGGSAATIGPGGYAMMPSKHVHQFTCTAACSGFIHSDGAFDLHYVDANGAEIPPDKALKKP